MRFYLPETDLFLSKSKTQTNELRGGKYAARVQIGYEEDGSPKYRYFKTPEEYENYLQNNKKSSKRSDKDDDKKDSKKKDKKGSTESKNKKKHSLLLEGSKNKKKKSDSTKKSMRFYLGEVE